MTTTKQPTFIAYTVRERKGRKPFWVKIGGAWPHESGKGFTINLDALPLDGRIVLTEPRPEDAREAR